MDTSKWKDKKPELSKWQGNFILDRYDDDLAIACCGVSSGKSAALAIWIVLQCMQKPGIRCIMVAQDYGALQKALIREIQIFCNWSGIEYNIQNKKEIHFSNGSHIFGYSAENPTSVLGLSEISLLAIDEAAYIPEEMYNYCKDRMRGGKYKSMTRLISSPNSISKVQNWFGEIVKKYPDKVVHASALDNRFISDEFKRDLKERYIEGTNLYKQQVLGEIVDCDVASQIVFRNQFSDFVQGNSTEYYLGYDAAGLGADKDVIMVINKYGIVDYKELLEADTFTKAGVISDFYNKYNIKYACADATGGYSLGVLDTLKSKNINVLGINFAQKAYSESYPNARTEMYLELATEIKNGFYVSYPNIREEILAQQVTINNKGLQALVPKDMIKKNIGHSPDHSDALALAIYAMKHGSPKEDEAKRASETYKKYLYYLNLNRNAD